jgi:hypothetical protein
MRLYRIKDDWITFLQDRQFRNEMSDTLRSLDLAHLQKYPPPKINGLPIGNETRVFSRFIRRQSSQLDASALSSLYRRFLSAEDKVLYQAFRMNEPLSTVEWSNIIGHDTVEKWIENRCLETMTDGSVRCQFSIVSIDGIVFCVDPLKDHGKIWEPNFIVDQESDISEEIQPFFHTYIGLDSLRMIELMKKEALPNGGRYLDCGPGCGSLLLYFGRRFDEALGVDISARAATLAQFNAELNGLSNCKTVCDDALAIEDKYGKFDLVSWNLPFIFMPAEHEDVFIDGYGGEMGIGLCLKFIETIPQLLSKRGLACVAALSPILGNGENVLEGRLREKLGRLGLDCTLKVAQISLAENRELWNFHQSRNISRFESVYLYIKAGTGRLNRIGSPVSRRLVDKLREQMYARRFSENRNNGR